ncbi:hypothetical protein, partial [uncultured Streptococcus sp.]|uniref:hypothetical protein n=1 Tax=uncultured Streptococcus sp. TaxID=83427 RepID=UPI0028D18D50
GTTKSNSNELPISVPLSFPKWQILPVDSRTGEESKPAVIGKYCLLRAGRMIKKEQKVAWVLTCERGKGEK